MDVGRKGGGQELYAPKVEAVNEKYALQRVFGGEKKRG